MSEINIIKSPEIEKISPKIKEYGISDDFFDEIGESISQENKEKIKELISTLDAPLIADLLEFLDYEKRKYLVNSIKEDFNPEILTELDEEVADEIIDILGIKKVGDIVEELDSDDAVNVFELLEEEEQIKVLQGLPVQDREVIKQGMSYPEDSAGRLMKREMVAVPEYVTVEQVIKYLKTSKNIPEEFFVIYLVDAKHKPVARVMLDKLILADKKTRVIDISKEVKHPIPVSMDQEEVALLFRQKNWISSSVVDENGRLLGVITIDDIVDVIDEEATDDLLGLSGASDGDLYRDILKTTSSRFRWLIVNLGAAIMASFVVGQFEDVISKIVMLAVLMPIVASMGGNAGHQTLAITIRALALKELTKANMLRIVSKEFFVGALNGMIFALLIGTITWFWYQDASLTLVIALAMTLNLLSAGLAGILIPLIMEKLKIDPALSSSVFVTAITDMGGFFIFLGLAKVLMFS